MREFVPQWGRRLSLCWVVAGLAVGPAAAQVAEPSNEVASGPGESDTVELDPVEVRGDLLDRLREKGVLADTIEKTETITSDDIREVQAGTLKEAIEKAPGVRVSNECSMCGIKRVMLNGLRGEQTTILVDGVPMHSVVASYYGIDAITAAGIERIEVARGPGASLAAPEAIGGTVNIITKRAVRNEVIFDVSAGNDGYRKYSTVATGVANEGRTRATIAAQYDDQDRRDSDNNGVSESPDLENSSIVGRVSHDIGQSSNIEGRIAHYESNVFGGPLGIEPIAAIRSEADGESAPNELFEGGDVRRDFTGFPWETAEIIETERTEVTGRWLQALGGLSSLTVTGNYVEHKQDSFYEGFDYANTLDAYFGDVKYTRLFGPDFELTIGADVRREELRSQSDFVDRDPDLVSDAYDFTAIGGYIQSVWTPLTWLEVSVAARLDNLTADFLEQREVDNEVDETLISPRLHVRWFHTDALTSRFAAGRGYRAPLSFFESEHGILEDGFNVQTDEVETSIGLSYALSYEGRRFSITGSAAWTQLENAAFIDTDNFERPTLVSSEETFDIGAIDVTASVDLNAITTLSATAETVLYEESYQETFAVAPLEERVRVEIDFEPGRWDIHAGALWVGGRDLADYGYEGFNVIGSDGSLSSPKTLDAPSFTLLDVRVERGFGRNWSVYAGATNLTDYTQAEDEETPLFWDADGGYDVAYIFGPLRGRTIYAGARLTL